MTNIHKQKERFQIEMKFRKVTITKTNLQNQENHHHEKNLQTQEILGDLPLNDISIEPILNPTEDFVRLGEGNPIQFDRDLILFLKPGSSM